MNLTRLDLSYSPSQLEATVSNYISIGGSSIVAEGDLTTTYRGRKKHIATTSDSIRINGERVTLAPGEERKVGGYRLRGTAHGIKGEQL